MRVALFSTCLVDALFPDAGEATVTLLRAAIAPASQDTREIPRDYRATTQDGIKAFLERLAHYDARAIPTSESDLADAVRTTLKDRGVRNLVAPDGLPDAWLTEVNPLRDGHPPLENGALDASDGCLTTCALAIAQTRPERS